MGDLDDRREFITSNALVLTKSTVIGIELVIHLFSKGLIDDEEKDLLSADTPNFRRAKLLYTSIANKWSQCQFNDFQTVLKDTGNLLALQVFTNAGADVFLTNDQVQLLKDQRGKPEDGCYEGLSYEDEVKANRVVQFARGASVFREDGKFVLSGRLERREVVPLVKTFAEALNNLVVWWNPRKPRLLSNYIERSVAETHHFEYDGTLRSPVQPNTLMEVVKENLMLVSDPPGMGDPFAIDEGDDVSIPSKHDTLKLLRVNEELVLLVDPPGMGKSTEMTNLEQKLRNHFSSERIIVRVNLNEVQRELSSIKSSESASTILLKLAPFLPQKTLKLTGIRIIILFDGLDEVCPKYKNTILTLLHALKSNEDINVHRIVVSTRPHLRKAVESNFRLKSWSLVPLTVEEQLSYMERFLNISTENLDTYRSGLPKSLRSLLRNPLMLFMLVDLLNSGGILSAQHVDLYELYSRFVELKQKLHLVEKDKMGPDDNSMEIRLDTILERNLPFYFHVALRELYPHPGIHGFEKSIGTDCWPSTFISSNTH